MVDLFFTITFIFSFLRSFSENHCTKRRCSCCFSYFCSTFAGSSTNSLSGISPDMLTFGSSLSVSKVSKIIFKKNKKKNNGLFNKISRRYSRRLRRLIVLV